MANIEKLSGRLSGAFQAANQMQLIIICAHSMSDEPGIRDMLKSIQTMNDRLLADLEALKEKALKNEKAVKNIAKIVQ